MSRSQLSAPCRCSLGSWETAALGGGLDHKGPWHHCEGLHQQRCQSAIASDADVLAPTALRCDISEAAGLCGGSQQECSNNR
jgi:hypothetical protein